MIEIGEACGRSVSKLSLLVGDKKVKSCEWGIKIFSLQESRLHFFFALADKSKIFLRKASMRVTLAKTVFFGTEK